MNYEIIKHGVQWSDYFQGCGTSFTEFDHVVTGIGDTEDEAFGECMDQIGMTDHPSKPLAHLLNALEKEHESMSVSVVTDVRDEDGELDDSSEHPWVHISIRYNLTAEVSQ